MKKIRIIDQAQEQKLFSKYTAYCFQDETGWTERLFPLDSVDRAVGFFENDKLVTGLISKGFTSRLFHKLVPSAGISCVFTVPEFRNKGQIKQLLTQVIREDYEQGKFYSALYPFKYYFYQKFGYGSLGMAYFYSFNPNDIVSAVPSNVNFVEFNNSQQHLDTIIKIYNDYIQHYDFGILHRKTEIDKFYEDLKRDKEHLFLYQNNNGKYEGFIRFHLKSLALFVTRLEVRRIAWRNTDAFKALMHFLWMHRDQCREITWTAPVHIPVNWVMKEPRLDQKCTYLWMARPLDVQSLLEMKCGVTPVNGKISFSINDEIIPENTGTYVVENDKVLKTKLQEEKVIPLHLFSSLLFGGISLRQALLAHHLEIENPVVAEQFFTINQNIFLSEFF